MLSAAAVVAGECRLLGVPEEQARALVRGMPYSPGSVAFSRIARQIDKRIRYVYSAERAVLTGCCRDPRPRNEETTTSKLRKVFQPYCDAECKKSCSMLAAIRNPERSLYGTPYEALDQSALWLHGGKLGEAGHHIWRLLALLAYAQGSETIHASINYVTMKLDGRYSRSHVRDSLQALHRDALVELVDRRTGERRLRVLATEQIRELERSKGVLGARGRNIAEARAKADDYLAWLADPIEDWTLPEDESPERNWTWTADSDLSPLERWETALAARPDPNLPPSSFDSGPRFLANWGGNIKAAYEWNKYDRYSKKK